MDLLLKLVGCLAIAQVRGYLVDRVQTHTATLTDYIASGEIELVGLSVMLDLWDPFAHLLFNLFVVRISLDLQTLSAADGCSECCGLGIFSQRFELLLELVGVDNFFSG